MPYNKDLQNVKLIPSKQVPVVVENASWWFMCRFKCVGLNPGYVIYWLLTFVAKYLFEENSAVQSQEELHF